MLVVYICIVYIYMCVCVFVCVYIYGWYGLQATTSPSFIRHASELNHSGNPMMRHSLRAITDNPDVPSVYLVAFGLDDLPTPADPISNGRIISSQSIHMTAESVCS